MEKVFIAMVDIEKMVVVELSQQRVFSGARVNHNTVRSKFKLVPSSDLSLIQKKKNHLTYEQRY